MTGALLKHEKGSASVQVDASETWNFNNAPTHLVKANACSAV